MERFWNKVNKTEDSCWLWTASTRNGYGSFKIDGKVFGAHVVSYLLSNPEVDIYELKGMVIMHSCDNKLCVNPNHLSLGTYSENSKDAVNKKLISIPIGKRFIKGMKATNAKLSEEEAKSVKERVKNRTISLSKLAKELNLPYQLIRDISCGRVYSNY